MSGQTWEYPRGFDADVMGQAKDLADLLIRKHGDYGPDNIARAPGGALNGVVVRLHDKMSRLAHLSETGKAPNNESIRDTYMDMANYALIGLMILDGQWPGVPDE
ncbi:MAG: DUF1599 domain-containing protein [Gemmatimonadota bacterium]|nr:DUF1599 domain-containing protein [Gemmatimonadota bacterium]